MTTRPLSPREVGLRHGFRSGLEETIAQQLIGAGVPVVYEQVKIGFTEPAKSRSYRPDFVLPNGIIIESKGRFLTADRAKHKLVAAQCPDLDIRFVFSSSKSRISKASKTTYALWCDTQRIPYADRMIPVEWLEEAPNHASLTALATLGYTP